MDAAIVPNFIVVDTDYQMLPEQLTDGVRHFTGSVEYSAIDDTERDRPDIVFSALVKLCIRLHKQEINGSLPWHERATLRQIHEQFERIAREDTASTKYTLVTIMFDRLAIDQGWEILPNLQQRFGPETGRLFDLWIK